MVRYEILRIVSYVSSYLDTLAVLFFCFLFCCSRPTFPRTSWMKGTSHTGRLLGLPRFMRQSPQRARRRKAGWEAPFVRKTTVNSRIKTQRGHHPRFYFNYDHTLHVGCPPGSIGVIEFILCWVIFSLSLLHVSTKKTSLIESIIDRKDVLAWYILWFYFKSC